MRTVLLLLLLAALPVSPATAGTITIDPFFQSVETSRFRLAFDYDRPELMRSLYFKDWSTLKDLAGESSNGLEFWGMTFRGVASPGFLRNDRIEAHTWEVLPASGDTARVRIWSVSDDEPSVTTTYTFVPDEPWFVVDRTVHFAEHPDTAACQLYAARVGFLNSYHALRWRDVSGAYLQRGYCVGGCETPAWDGRWLEHVSLANNGGYSVAQIYLDSMAPATDIARGSGPESYAGWVSPILPSGYKATDASIRLLVALSTSPGDTTRLDSLWAWFNARNHAVTAVDAPAPRAPRLALAASPNPAAGPTRLAWTLAARARVRLEVLDPSGRRVATPLDGEQDAGAHALAWDGRGADGRRVPPGVYLARIVTPSAVATARIVRVR